MNVRRSVYPLCRHTKNDGRLCNSPACGPSLFCYFHKKQHHIRRTPPVDPGPTINPHVLHPLRNATSILHALAMVVSGLGNGQLGPAQAGRMIYALQLARTNPRKR